MEFIKSENNMGLSYFPRSNNNIHSVQSQSKSRLKNQTGVCSKTGSQLQLKLPQKRKCQCGVLPLLSSGSILFTLGLLSIKYTCSDILLTMRLKMDPSYPAYELWLNPKPEVRLNVYIFTVDNADEFLNGDDSKIKIKEIGPIVYREYLQHRDVVFHDNSTLSYTAFRWAEFVPHANTPGILNQTITVPNFAILAAAGFVNSESYLLQIGYNFVHKTANERVFINISIYDYLWNYRSSLLQKAKAYAPSMVPTLNSGILNGIYVNNADRYNVRIGTKYGDSQFFLINTVNGVSTVPGYDVKNGDCYASVENSTEGAMYRQHLTKKSVLWFWRRALCRTVALHFEKEMLVNDILAYKYTLKSNMYDRLENKTSDCYKGVKTELQDGLTDVSKCYFNMPFAASLPHFYGRSENFTKKFVGLKPNEANHTSFTIVEPKIGVPLVQSARSQMNLVIPEFSMLFHKEYQSFSGMILPLFWIEYYQKDLTPDIIAMVNFFINKLPIIEYILTSILLLLGFGLLTSAFVIYISSRWDLLNSKEKSIQQPSIILFENKVPNNLLIVENNTGI